MHERAMELLSIFHMEDLAKAKASSLPYGAQRRLEILRALATNPSLLLLDEPAAGMNPSETAELMENIRSIRDTFKICLLYTSLPIRITPFRKGVANRRLQQRLPLFYGFCRILSIFAARWAVFCIF